MDTVTCVVVSTGLATTGGRLGAAQPIGEPTPGIRVDRRRARSTRRRQLVDGRGRSISTAILYPLACAMRDLPPGTMIKVRTDFLPAVDSDIRAWCRTTGHHLVKTEAAVDARDHTIRKAAEVRRAAGRAMVISNPGLQELLSPLGFALAAALAGNSVAIYFQGPAVRVLTRSFSEKLTGWQPPSVPSPATGSRRLGTPRTRSSANSRTSARTSTSAGHQWSTSMSQPKISS